MPTLLILESISTASQLHLCFWSPLPPPTLSTEFSSRQLLNICLFQRTGARATGCTAVTFRELLCGFRDHCKYRSPIHTASWPFPICGAGSQIPPCYRYLVPRPELFSGFTGIERWPLASGRQAVPQGAEPSRETYAGSPWGLSTPVHSCSVAGTFHTEFHPMGLCLIEQIWAAGSIAPVAGNIDIWPKQGLKS